MNIGRYEVIRKLATGGMAEVFLARVGGPLGFEKTLVVKRILPHLADEPTFVDMFLAEAKLAAQLNHPHIAQIFDFGETDGAYFLAMEYIDGPNLRTLVKQASSFGILLHPALCAKMIAAACEGLAYAHDFRDTVTQKPLDLIHRDISPDNILLSRQGAVKVADFGIAKAAGYGPKTQEGILKGKLPYMSPEHLRGKKLDRRADVYALGLVLYELLTCRKPFDVTTDAELLRAILDEPLIPAVERRPELPSPLQYILARALAKERDERYPDCLSFQAELERFILLEGETLGSLHIARLITQLESTAEQASLRTQPVALAAPSTHSMLGSTLSLPHSGALAVPENPARATSTVRTLQRKTRIVSRQQVRSPTAGSSSEGVLDEAASFEEKMRLRGHKQAAASTLAALLFISGGGYLMWRGGGAPLAASQSAPLHPTAPITEVGVDIPDAGPSLGKPGPEAALSLAPPLSEVKPDVRAAPAPLLPGPDAEPLPASPLVAAAPLAKSPRPPQNAKPSVGGSGSVEFRVVPYATVFIDGKEFGTTPFDPIEVSAGRHTVRLVNPAFPKAETRTIYVKPGEQLVVKHNFETQ